MDNYRSIGDSRDYAVRNFQTAEPVLTKEQLARKHNDFRLANVGPADQPTTSEIPSAPLLGFESSVWEASEALFRNVYALEALHSRIYGVRDTPNSCGVAESEPNGALERMECALSSLHSSLERLDRITALLAEVA